MTKLIVGLGNPGKEYQHNRHNVGYLFLDYLSEKLNCDDFNDNEKFNSLLSFHELNGNDIILLKPMTYMNSSGISVQKVMNFYNIKSDNLLVIYDEIDLNLGSVKFVKNRTTNGHNGLRSINSMISLDYYKIKIGVGRPINNKISISSHVLSNFTKDEFVLLDTKIFNLSYNFIEDFLN
jgi:PTH1 family peptidyl-tRNA hydrolase